MIRGYLLVALLTFAVGQAPPPEAYPGQANHAEPPAGWFCRSDDKRPAHKCTCKKMSKATAEDPKCEETPIEPPEDRTCTVWCHKDHCLCKVECVTGGHHQ